LKIMGQPCEFQVGAGTPARRPVHLEVCAGSGEWVTAQCQAAPGVDWVALELRHRWGEMAVGSSLVHPLFRTEFGWH
jgi:tRNA G46 methylase TrmB